MAHLLSSSCAILLLVLLASAAWSDVRDRRVPNLVVAATVVLWLVQTPLSGMGDAVAALGVGLGLLALGIVVWRLGWLGAGDAKLIAALGLWAGTSQALEFLLVTSVAGGALAFGQMLARRLLANPFLVFARHWLMAWTPASHLFAAAPRPASSAQTVSLPYAVAIAAGGGWLALGRLAI